MIDVLANGLAPVFAAARSVASVSPPAGASQPVKVSGYTSDSLRLSTQGSATPFPTSTRGPAIAASPSPTLAATPDTTAREIKNFSPFYQDQGNTNGCGTTSLAMLLSWWENAPGKFQRTTIDEQIRPIDGPTAPQSIEDYARDQGYNVSERNHSTLDDLAKNLDAGIPAMVLYNSNGNPDGKYLHYMVAIGYSRDATGKINTLRFANPAGGNLKTIDADTFDQRWKNLPVMGHDTGIDRLMITLLPKSDVLVTAADGTIHPSSSLTLPQQRGLGWKAMIADRGLDVIDTFTKLVPDQLKGLFG